MGIRVRDFLVVIVGIVVPRLGLRLRTEVLDTCAFTRIPNQAFR